MPERSDRRQSTKSLLILEGDGTRRDAKPSVSVIICAYTEHRWQLLGKAIASAQSQQPPPDEILLVIDHNAILLARARDAFPNVRVVSNTETPGLSGARNTGIRESRGDLLVFLDDDAIAHPDWLEKLLEPFEEPEVMGTGGSALPVWAGAEPRWLPREFLWVVGAAWEGLPRRRSRIRNPMGGTMAFRREAFDRVGVFSDGIGRIGRTPMGCEETEFAIRVQQGIPGSTVVYAPDARIDHYIPPERTTWRYFLSRCWAEGISKALVTNQVGFREGLASERAYTVRTLPPGFLAGLRAAGRGDLFGLARSIAIFSGLLLAIAGYLRKRVSRPDRPPRRRRRGARFQPVIVRSVELTEPLAPIIAGRSPYGTPYGSALVLVRLHGQPLGVVNVPLKQGRVSAEKLAHHLWTGVNDRIVEPAAAADGASIDVAPEQLMHGLEKRPPASPLPGIPSDEAPHVTVIVPTSGQRRAQLEACIRSLRSLRYPHFDVLVVDNRPADSSTRLVVEAQAREDARVRYSAEPRPGSSVARNNGIVQTRAQIVAFTDDDVIVDRDWLAALVTPFLHDCQIAATTGLVLPAELETPAQWYFEQRHGFDKGFGPRVFDLQGHRAEGRLYPYWGGVFGPRHTMAFRRSVLREMGGFDPALGAGTLARAGEDVDAFTHLIVRGKRLAYEPRAICWHAHRRGDDALRHQLFDHAASLTAILTKWSLRNPALLLRMLPAVLTKLRTSPSASSGENEPLLRQLHPFEIGGYVLGPILYLRSVARARRHGLAQMSLKDTAGPTSGEH